MKKVIVSLMGILTILMLSSPVSVHGARLKDIASFKGIRPNQLVGYGLVVGLNGTGDTSTNVEFTIRSIANMLERMLGVHIDRERINQVKLKNVAAVMVTATIPPFSRIGNRIDVHISSIGDAKSLLGGTLLMTPLKGIDEQVYALAAGPVVTGGFSVTGASGSSVQKNVPTGGMISKGATVEKEIPVNLDSKKEVALSLFNPDFTTAERVKEAINRSLNGAYAKCEDSGTIRIAVPESFQRNVAGWISSVERLEVTRCRCQSHSEREDRDHRPGGECPYFNRRRGPRQPEHPDQGEPERFPAASLRSCSAPRSPHRGHSTRRGDGSDRRARRGDRCHSRVEHQREGGRDGAGHGSKRGKPRGGREGPECDRRDTEGSDFDPSEHQGCRGVTG